MFINIPEFGKIEDPKRRGEELERFLRELVAKVNEELNYRPMKREVKEMIGDGNA